MLHFGPQVVMPPRPPDAPRKVPSKAVSWSTRFFLVFIPPWLCIAWACVIVFTAAGGPVWDDWILDKRAVSASVTPTSVTRTSMRVNHRRMFRIHARLVDKAGTAHHVSYATASSFQLRRAREHRPFTVEYDPRDPSRYRFHGQRASTFGNWVFLPLAFGLLLLPLMIVVLLSRARQRAIYRHGDPTLGRVEKHTGTGGSQGHRPVMRVHYLFESPDGDAVHGSVETLTPPPVGTALWVIYDPNNPRRNIAAMPLPRVV